MQKLRATLVGAQGYPRFPLSKPVIGLNIALCVMLCLLTGFLPIPSDNLPSQFIQLYFPQISPILLLGMCIVVNQNFYLW